MIDLLESQYWSLEKLKDFQTMKMREIIKFSYENIKGYRHLYNSAGVNIKDIKELEDLKKLPVVERKDLQSYNDWISKKHIKTHMRTGGSTGEPLIYHEDEWTRQIRAQKHNRGWLWSGYNQEQDKRAVVCSLRGGIGKGKRILNIDGRLEEKDMLSVLMEIRKFKPVQIRAYVSTAYILAQWIINNNFEIHIPSINLIAEQLYKDVRMTISKAFHGTVFEEYVCCDGGSSAWDCEYANGLHECMERSIIEAGVNGEMIVTDLWNLASPFIRYKNGDFIKRTSKNCLCGRELPIIEVVGRDNDIIKLPSGHLSPSYLLHHISHSITCGKKFIDYKSFQIIQEKDYSVHMDIVKGVTFSREDEETLLNILGQICVGVDIKVMYVNELKKSVSGKIKFIISGVE